MSPRTEAQYEEIREEKKELIKRVALEIISEHGIQNTSISKIAKEAGVSKGLMYNYFESKEDLLKRIILLQTRMILSHFVQLASTGSVLRK